MKDSRWKGNVGRLASENKEELFSVFTFDNGGRGYEELFYKSDGLHYRTDYFAWEFFYDYDDYIVLSYRDGREFIDRVRFNRNSLEGVHYLDEREFELHRGGMGVILTEEYKDRY